jgi:hypothetical protein
MPDDRALLRKMIDARIGGAALVQVIVMVANRELTPKEAARLQVEAGQDESLVFVEHKVPGAVVTIRDQEPWRAFFQRVRDEPEYVDLIREAFREAVDRRGAEDARWFPPAKIERTRKALLSILDGATPSYDEL